VLWEYLHSCDRCQARGEAQAGAPIRRRHVATTCVVAVMKQTVERKGSASSSPNDLSTLKDGRASAARLRGHVVPDCSTRYQVHDAFRTSSVSILGPSACFPGPYLPSVSSACEVRQSSSRSYRGNRRAKPARPPLHHRASTPRYYQPHFYVHSLSSYSAAVRPSSILRHGAPTQRIPGIAGEQRTPSPSSCSRCADKSLTRASHQPPQRPHVPCGQDEFADSRLASRMSCLA
jgi:hypothetical protein